jgi:hypothetical protein
MDEKGGSAEEGRKKEGGGARREEREKWTGGERKDSYSRIPFAEQ